MPPIHNKPKVTQTDVTRGYVVRYFVQNVSTRTIVEVDRSQYETYRNDPYYVCVELQWFIGGPDVSHTLTNGVSVMGTEEKNQAVITFYDRKMPGLRNVLRNPLEFFSGKRVVAQSPYVPLQRTPGSELPPDVPVVVYRLSNVPTTLDFIVTQSASVPAQQFVYLRSQDEAQTITGLDATISYSGPTGWLTSSLSASFTPTTMSVVPTTTLLTTGSYTASISVTSTTLPILQTASVNVTMNVVSFGYETNFMDFYRLTTTVNLDTYGPYTYGGGPARWQARDFNLINITSNVSNNIARLRHPIQQDRVRVSAYYFRYNAASTNYGGLCLFAPTGSSDVDFVRVNHESAVNRIVIADVSSSGAETTLAASANNSTPIGLNTGIEFVAEISNGIISVYSGSAFICSASVPTRFLGVNDRTIGFHSYASNQAGGLGFGNLTVTRLELQPFTGSVPVWNNTVMHLDASNSSSYIGSNEWQDLTGFFNSASGVGVTYTSSAGGAFDFGGGPDRMGINGRYSTKPELPMTFITWIKTVTGSNQGLFTNDLGLGTTYRGVWINLNTLGQIGANYGSGGAPAGSSRRTGTTTTSIPNNQWTHVACVIRGATDMSVYFNGVSQSMSFDGTGGAISYTTTTGSLGYTGTNGPFYFTGSMGMASLFGAGLTDNEILLHFNRTRQRFGV